jgi:hypothetical protein
MKHADIQELNLRAHYPSRRWAGRILGTMDSLIKINIVLLTISIFCWRVYIIIG